MTQAIRQEQKAKRPGWGLGILLQMRSQSTECSPGVEWESARGLMSAWDPTAWGDHLLKTQHCH